MGLRVLGFRVYVSEFRVRGFGGLGILRPRCLTGRSAAEGSGCQPLRAESLFGPFRV